MTGTAILPDEQPEAEVAAGDGPALPPEPTAPSPAHRLARGAGLVGIAALAIPFVAIVVLSLTRRWWPTGDVALMELRTHDVGGSFSPQLGVYSRFGWYHPGPLAYWLLALPYRLLGARPAGMLVGTALLHALAAGGTVALAWRRGGRSLAMVAALVLVVLIRGLGVDKLAFFWNPYLPLLMVAFLLIATWCVLDGDIQLLPFVLAASCFSWQAHFGYLPVTGLLAGLAGLGTIVLVWRDRRPRRRADEPGTDAEPGDRPPPRYSTRSLVVLALATAATAAVCLGPIVAEQLGHEPGNVSLIAESLSDRRDEAIGADKALGIVAAHVSPTGVWLTGSPTVDITLGPSAWLRLALPVLAVGAAGVLAARACQASAVRFLALTSVSAVVGLVAIARTVGSAYPYLSDWMRPVGVLLWVSVGWALVATARARRWVPDRVERRVVPAAALAVVAATIGVSVVSVTGGALHLPDEDGTAPLNELGAGAVRATAGQGLVRLRAGGGWCAGELAHGIAAQLVEHGTDVVVDPRAYPLEYGRERARAEDAVPVVELVCGTDAGDRVSRTDVEPVATYDLLSAEDLARYREVRTAIQGRLRVRGRPDAAEGVENPIVGASAVLAASGDPLDRELADSFEAFLGRGNRGGAIYYWPDGVSRVAG